MTVSQAAEMLGVHPQRVHQRIRAGSLAAEKIGNQWLMDEADVRRVAERSSPGRPLSSKSAWDVFAVCLGDSSASELSPVSRSRARSRLRELLASASDADAGDISALLGRALRNRAERVPYVASPRDLPDLRADERVHLSGLSLPESNLAAGDSVEGYVLVDRLDGLVDDYLLSPADRDRANVILHVAPAADSPGRRAVDLADMARSPLTLAADLAEYDGVREKHEALRLIADLGRIVAREERRA
ncbi:helix-turn-helix domain-containing protein [Nocardioides sp. W7]|uniref:helix-turn-helix domain-containing protein n=1 Tax=Nocardioides sp. W7 TaxID=2931390 RepID=UPI001FD2ADC0|nr:helix-turn-helix domain-containing protein [Nocardioides sp. W7]